MQLSCNSKTHWRHMTYGPSNGGIIASNTPWARSTWSFSSPTRWALREVCWKRPRRDAALKRTAIATNLGLERRNNPLQPTPFWALSWEFLGWFRKKMHLFFWGGTKEDEEDEICDTSHFCCSFCCCTFVCFQDLTDEFAGLEAGKRQWEWIRQHSAAWVLRFGMSTLLIRKWQKNCRTWLQTWTL